MRILICLMIIFFSSISFGRDNRDRHKSIEATVNDWWTSAEQAVEKKDFVKALQLYGALRDQYQKDGNTAGYESLGTWMNKIYWYCIMYYYLTGNKKEVKWYIDQRLSRNQNDADATEFSGYLNAENDDRIKEFLDKKFWGCVNYCVKVEQVGDEFGQTRWWLRKKLELQPDDEKAKKLLEVLKNSEL